MFYSRDLCLQADETPCTILYLIKGQKVDVGKGVITNPLRLMFHNQPMPAWHFRVNLSSVNWELQDPAVDWKLQGLGAAMAKESFSSGVGREHTNNHTSASMCGDHHPAYTITSSCSDG